MTHSSSSRISSAAPEDNRPSNVIAFWDFENCPVSDSRAHNMGRALTFAIRSIAEQFGRVKFINAYLELDMCPEDLKLQLLESGVSLQDCPHMGRKDVSDKHMLTDMLLYSRDELAHDLGKTTYIIITGDRDFAYAISCLRMRDYNVVVVSNGSNSALVHSVATFSWQDLTARAKILAADIRASTKALPVLCDRSPDPTGDFGTKVSLKRTTSEEIQVKNRPKKRKSCSKIKDNDTKLEESSDKKRKRKKKKDKGETDSDADSIEHGARKNKKHS